MVVLETSIGGSRTARVGYRLADVGLLPSRRTRDVDLVEIGWGLDAYSFDAPVLGAPLDAVTSPSTAKQLSALGGAAILNLEGLWTRYESPEEVLAEIALLQPGPGATAALQRYYSEPVKEDLIGRRVDELRASGFAAGSLTPQKVERYHHVALEAGLDLLVVQGVAVTAQHVGDSGMEPLDLRSFTARYDIPVVVGGVWSAKTAIHLMRTGAVGVIVEGDGDWFSTTAEALGIRAPLATTIAEVAAARTQYLQESGRYVQVIASGGIETGGDLAKAIACGADAAMLGLPLARADEAPGRGAYWGLAAAHHELPRGRFGRVEQLGPLQVILEGPAQRDDGQANILGGLRRAMAITGYETLARFHDAELTVSLR
jgi:IMP dehydrogenase